jgi:phosphopantothenoylcysteine decarboxylase / phosphopantothenate---cysteine ligase
VADVVSDLSVEPIANALRDWHIDVIVSGSIGAVESVRLIRALRRLGAAVYPWLSPGGAQFITPLALEWAANRHCMTEFAGLASHLATRHACVIAPCSANFAANLAAGKASDPSLALAQSYLGQKLPIVLVPTMHDSLKPSAEVALKALTSRGAHLVPVRVEEGKQKFPEPALLADQIAHQLNHKKYAGKSPVLVTLGGTRAPLDSVRSIQNHSTGALGTLICHELFRRGLAVDALVGTGETRPTALINGFERCETYDAMRAAVAQKKSGRLASIFAAAVLDYVPDQAAQGKIPSGQKSLSVQFKPTDKIIELVSSPIKVGFKLFEQVDDLETLAKSYCQKFGLSLLVTNHVQAVSASNHQAEFFWPDGRRKGYDSKAKIAEAVADHVEFSGVWSV